MAHLRTTIRNAVKTAVTGLASTGSRVFASRVYPLQATDLPCLMIYTIEDKSKVATRGPSRQIHRTVTLAVDALAGSSATMDDTLDEICRQVEVALHGSTLGGAALDVRLDTTTIGLDGSSDQPLGVARMTWLVDYQHTEGTPS